MINAGCGLFLARASSKSASAVPESRMARTRLWVLAACMAGLITSSCGRSATLEINAPSSTVAGSPFTVTVTAMIGDRPDKVINSVVRFTSSDAAAVLPGDYQFTVNDAGSHTFANGVILRTAGKQTITATIFDASALTATANITVSAVTTSTSSR
jgi:hypothetical protein